VFYDVATTKTLAGILVAGYHLCTNNTDPAIDPYTLYRNHWREHRWKAILRKMGLFLALFGTLLGFLLGFIYVFIMKGAQVQQAASVIGVCLATILGTTFLIIDNQYFVTIFENTIGYQCLVSQKSTRDTLQSVIQHKTFEKQAIFPGMQMMMSFLLSVFYMNNFGFVLQQIGAKDSTFDFTITEDETDKEKHIENLAKCVVRKHAIGHLCWLYFASIVATMISTKYLAKMG
jgi:hypothetical protein